MAINVKGHIFCRANANSMLANKTAGQIVNISSISAYACFSELRLLYRRQQSGDGEVLQARLADDNIRVYEIRPGLLRQI